MGATNDARSLKTALFLLDGGALPVCWVNSAFFFAMAAAASGNMALIVDESRPELRLAPGEGGGRPREFRELSTLSFDMASFKRLDMASICRFESATDKNKRLFSGIKNTFFSKVRGGQQT